MLGDLVVGVVAGKGDEDHGHQGNDCENEESQQGKGEKGDVEFAVGQKGNVPSKAVGAAADDGGLLQGVGLLYRAKIDQHEEENDEGGQDPVQHDVKGVISRDLHEFSQIGIPHVRDMGLHPSYVTAGEEVFEEHTQIAAAEEDGVENEENLRGEVNESPHELSAEQMPKTHDQVGGLGDGVTLCKIGKEAPNPAHRRAKYAPDPPGSPPRSGLDPGYEGAAQADERRLGYKGEVLVGWPKRSGR